MEVPHFRWSSRGIVLLLPVRGIVLPLKQPVLIVSHSAPSPPLHGILSSNIVFGLAGFAGLWTNDAHLAVKWPAAEWRERIEEPTTRKRPINYSVDAGGGRMPLLLIIPFEDLKWAHNGSKHFGRPQMEKGSQIRGKIVWAFGKKTAISKSTAIRQFSLSAEWLWMGSGIGFGEESADNQPIGQSIEAPFAAACPASIAGMDGCGDKQKMVPNLHCRRLWIGGERTGPIVQQVRWLLLAAGLSRWYAWMGEGRKSHSRWGRGLVLKREREDYWERKGEEEAVVGHGMLLLTVNCRHNVPSLSHILIWLAQQRSVQIKLDGICLGRIQKWSRCGKQQKMASSQRRNGPHKSTLPPSWWRERRTIGASPQPLFFGSNTTLLSAPSPLAMLGWPWTNTEEKTVGGQQTRAAPANKLLHPHFLLGTDGRINRRFRQGKESAATATMQTIMEDERGRRLAKSRKVTSTWLAHALFVHLALGTQEISFRCTRSPPLEIWVEWREGGGLTNNWYHTLLSTKSETPKSFSANSYDKGGNHSQPFAFASSIFSSISSIVSHFFGKNH
jgi:hypothetical protein